MARATFGRSGNKIIVADEPANDTIGIVEVEPVDDGPESIDSDTGNDFGFEGIAGGDFEPVAEPIRTIPITGAEPQPGFTDPTTAAGTGKKPRKPRGPNRPKDGTTSAQNTRVLTAQLDALLFAAHTMAATMLHEPLLSISEDESKVLAEAIEKMANAYNLSAILSPKTQATIDLCIALGTVYGPRVMMLRSKPRNVRNVTPINQTATSTQ